jgi:short-subunit dehydrogenase
MAGHPANKAEINLIKVELDSLDTVCAGAKELLGRMQKINILVNNAGVIAMPEGRTWGDGLGNPIRNQ